MIQFRELSQWGLEEPCPVPQLFDRVTAGSFAIIACHPMYRWPGFVGPSQTSPEEQHRFLKVISSHFGIFG